MHTLCSDQKVIISLTEVGQLHLCALAVYESLGLSQMSLVLSHGSLVLPLVQAEPHLEVHIAAGPSVEPVAQPLPGSLLVLVLQSSSYKTAQ